MLSFNIWIRCQSYGTTFSRIVDAPDVSSAVETYIRDIIARHGLSRSDLAVCMAQRI